MDPFGVYAQFGVVGLIILAVGVLILIVFKIDGRLRMIERSDNERTDYCGHQKDNMKKAFEKIDVLEEKDIEKVGRFKLIESNLTNIGETTSRTESKLDTVIQFYMEAGMKK